MRPIKFRCWDGKRMVWDGKPFWIIGETTMFDLLKQYPLEDYNDLVLMQFTGLLDKNGKEIYEGDIVVDRMMISAGERCVVEHDGMAGYVVSGDDGVFTLGRYRGDSPYEIIGNIYENPNLVEVSK